VNVSYEEELVAFQRAREERLRAPDGWLTALGPYWLAEGPNRCGRGADCQIPLRCSAEVAFTLEMRDGKVWGLPSPGVTVMTQTGPLEARALRHDLEPGSDSLRFETLVMEILQRNERYALRVRDVESPLRHSFPPLRWYPPNPALRVPATFVRHDGDRTIAIDVVMSGEFQLKNPGVVRFELGGRKFALEAVRQGQAQQLMLIFKDMTNGRGSYGAGRFLFVPFSYPNEAETKIELDFNKAISPPCAFTAAATCPLPPKSNYLEVAIEAGEQAPEGGEKTWGA
jgi:uncharacterized protein (DUF1684 family)